MAFGGGGGKGAVRSDINITPLVDVVLVLLIIFMVMTPILLKQFDVEVPEKASLQVAAPTSDQLVLQIAKDGTMQLNHESVTRDKVEERVKNALSGRKEKLMFFDVDEQANYGFAVEIMDLCRGAGVKTLGIMTK